MENLTVTSAGAQGKAIAKHDGLVVFVTGAVPGDVVDVRVTKKKSNYAEAITTRIVSPSRGPYSPFCKHFGTCGGCKWQDLSYPKQLEYKQQQVIDNLERIGGLELPAVTPIMPSREPDALPEQAGVSRSATAAGSRRRRWNRWMG